MAITLYISREKWNEGCIIPCMNNLYIKNFITRLQPEKLQWALTTKLCKKFLFLCCFYWATQHRLIMLFCWDQRHPCFFSESFCATYLVNSQAICRPKDILILHYYLARLSQKDRKNLLFFFNHTNCLI